MPKTTLSSQDIITRIAQALATMDGEAVAEFHNQVREDKIAYDGDSIWTEVDA